MGLCLGGTLGGQKLQILDGEHIWSANPGDQPEASMLISRAASAPEEPCSDAPLPDVRTSHSRFSSFSGWRRAVAHRKHLPEVGAQGRRVDARLTHVVSMC